MLPSVWGSLFMSQIKTNITRTINLNDVEQRLVTYISRQKQRHYEANNIQPILHTHRTADRYQHYIQAFGAEFAFCILHNVYPPTDIVEFNEWDVIVPNVGNVDIKSTELLDGRLIVNKKKANTRANAFALMVGTFPRYVFGGWMWVNDAIKKHHIKDLGHGPCYAIEQERLNRNLMIDVTR